MPSETTPDEKPMIPPAPISGMPFDTRLISEYDGSTDVIEWMARAEMMCQLRGVAFETILPLRFTGGAFAVWSQLPATSRCSLKAVHDALYAAFSLDQYAADEAFIARQLQPGDSANVFLADLRRLAACLSLHWSVRLWPGCLITCSAQSAPDPEPKTSTCRMCWRKHVRAE